MPLAFAGKALACACCADPGTWYEAAQPLDTATLGELSRLRFTGVARTVVGPGGLDAIRGISTPRAAYGLTVTRTGRAWRFDFGGTGSLTLPLPRSGLTFAADVHDGRMGGGGGPLLYKELRLEGTARASGAFRGGRFRLILQGRGNNCLNAADYRWWRLEVSGNGVSYALYGTFRKLAG